MAKQRVRRWEKLRALSSLSQKNKMMVKSTAQVSVFRAGKCTLVSFCPYGGDLSTRYLLDFLMNVMSV